MNKNATQALSTMFYGPVTFNGPMFDIHDNGTVVVHGGVPTEKEEDSPRCAVVEEVACAEVTDDERLARAVEEAQPYFWAQSAWAVVYCVCRDHLGVTETMTDFERRVQGLTFDKKVHACPAGTVRRAFANNDFMRYHIQRWSAGRAATLAEKLCESFT